MKLSTLMFASGLALAGAAFCAPASACNLENLEITEAPKPMVGTFDEAGKFQREVAKAEVIHRKILTCNESLGLVKIELADGKSVWIDPIEVKIPAAPAGNEVCLTSNNSKPHDARMVAAAGAEPAKKDCAPAAK